MKRCVGVQYSAITAPCSRVGSGSDTAWSQAGLGPRTARQGGLVRSPCTSRTATVTASEVAAAAAATAADDAVEVESDDGDEVTGDPKEEVDEEVDDRSPTNRAAPS
jgi:hypothetical protein